MRLIDEFEKYKNELKEKGFDNDAITLIETGMLKAANLLNVSIVHEIQPRMFDKADYKKNY